MGYMLRKGSRKDVCPACGRRTFTPYVDGDGTVLDPAVGMCDRKNKCNYHLPPRVFLNMHAGDSGPGGRHVRFKPSRHAVRYSPPEMIPHTTVGDTLRCYERNALVAWLKGVFRDGEFAAALDTTLARYKVGTSKAFGGSPVFWLIDHKVLENRDVVLFPDEGKYGEWLEKGRLLTRKCPNVWVSTVMEPDHPCGHGLKVQPGDGFDDLIVQALSDPTVDLAHLLLTAYRDEL